MAKIGLKNLVFKGVTSGLIGKSIQADISIELNDAKLYADDVLAESDTSFKSGTITLGIDDLSDTVQSEFLGHAVASGEITASINDESPYVGIGFYGTKKVGGVKKYRAVWIPKVQFKEPADANATKGDATAFVTPVLEGTIMADDNGNWKQEKTFDNAADAIAYLNDKAGLPISESTGLLSLSLTGTGGTLSPAFNTGVRYYTYSGLTGSSVTVNAGFATQTAKLYVDGVFSQNLVTATASGAISFSAVGSKKLTIVVQEAGKQSQTTEIIVVKTA